VHDLRIKPGRDGVEIVPPPGVEVVEDDFHGCVAHCHLPLAARAFSSTSIEDSHADASE